MRGQVTAAALLPARDSGCAAQRRASAGERNQVDWKHTGRAIKDAASVSQCLQRS